VLGEVGAVEVEAGLEPQRVPGSEAGGSDPGVEEPAPHRRCRGRGGGVTPTGVRARIVLLPGDGIGPEVVAEGTRVLRAVAEPGRDGPYAKSAPFGILLAAAFWLGANAWFWARAIVQFQFGPPALWEKNLYLTWAPRLLGVLPFGFLAGGLAAGVWTSSGALSAASACALSM